LIEAHQASKFIGKVRSLNLQIKPLSFLEVVITWSNEVFKGVEFDMTVRMRQLGNPSPKTAERNDTAK
jgi:hypothetical protein